ncbi:hypothetical protein HanPI659440_Chr03g0105951 [Helianthus annuus]|nr:hypothetical protein HanPI659440_Chr03g0105951 [Helianthus annuus]
MLECTRSFFIRMQLHTNGLLEELRVKGVVRETTRQRCLPRGNTAAGHLCRSANQTTRYTFAE